MSSWSRLIRFVAEEDGKIYQGEPVLPQDRFVDIGKEYAGLKAKILQGDIYGENSLSEETKTVKKLLSPVSKQQINLIRCMGLNYIKHIQEGHMAGKVPEWPTEFIKGRSALANPDEPTFIPKQAQDSMDLEAELCLVIGKTGRDIPKEKAYEYVLGFTVSQSFDSADVLSDMRLDWNTTSRMYTDYFDDVQCGNDVSWRRAQQKFPYSGSQWCFGKGLDTFAPLGPVLVSPKIIDPDNLKIASRLNGKDFQEDSTQYMMHSAAAIIAHFSIGTTLEAGDVIMTGTPQGVGYARDPPVWLKHGDQVEIEIENIGTLRHTIEYEQ